MKELEEQIPEYIRRIADSDERQLAWRFFVFFSRMEYALKRSGVYLMNGSAEAQPNWDKFASDYNATFRPETSSVLEAAVAYFLNNPPQRQVIKGGEMTWADAERRDQKEPLLIWLLRMIRRVRNNLFHGGKFPLIVVSEPSRDRELLRHALAVLNGCVSLDPRVFSSLQDDSI